MARVFRARVYITKNCPKYGKFFVVFQIPNSMNSHRPRLRPLCIQERKNADFEQPSNLKGGHLSPDLQPNTPPSFPDDAGGSAISQVGNYLLLDRLDSIGSVQVHKCFNCDTREEFICKVCNVLFYCSYIILLSPSRPTIHVVLFTLLFKPVSNSLVRLSSE